MRIVAGRLKGRTLLGPTGPGVRPTSDGLRETLFNVLAPRIAGARVLDGFAGTGAVGLEAVSRGASHVTFVERDHRAAAVLGKNIEACGAGDVTRVLREDLGRRPLGPFDIVFLDPPYDQPGVDEVLGAASTWLDQGGVLVLEHSRRGGAPDAAGRLARYRVLAAGDSALSFYAPGSSPLIPLAGRTLRDG